MKLPIIRGIIERRILANFRVQPTVLANVLPPPFRPQLVNDFGIAGICLIRLRAVRPKFLPLAIGLSSENAAHRIAVEWDEAGSTRTGVFVPRRDTSSRLNCFAGGRFFPGIQHHASFTVEEKDNFYCVAMTSRDQSANVLVEGQATTALPDDSVFESVEHVSRFFEEGSLGYSPSNNQNYDGMELKCVDWSVQPMDITKVESSFFNDSTLFPAGSVEFDNALLMLNIDHEWHAQQEICCD
jgi:hypothetical protein